MIIYGAKIQKCEFLVHVMSQTFCENRVIFIFRENFKDYNFPIFLLCFSGYDRRLPGFERYSVLGTDDNGMFNLQIVNATLEDDAIFECQVGPSLNNRPIRASARVNVMRKYTYQKRSCTIYFF